MSAGLLDTSVFIATESDRPLGALPERVAERVTRLTDDARVRAYEIMGDRPRAVAIMERRLVGTPR